MDLANIFSVTTFLVLLSISDVKSATVTLSTSSEKGQLGNYSISLFCNYTLSSEELLFYINFLRKRTLEASMIKIITFYENNVFNATYSNETSADLKGRTVLVNPVSSRRSAILQFDSIQCADEADYRCEMHYGQAGTPTVAISDSKLVVTASPKFENEALPYTPSNNLAENQTMTFTCSGNVGRNPNGTFVWYKYVNGQPPGMVINNGVILISQNEAPGSCINQRTENLTMLLKKEDNKMVMRCTVQQTIATEDGNGYKQTDPITVSYAPTNFSIARKPDQTLYSEGQGPLTLTCYAESNPDPKFIWTLPNGTVQMVSQLHLASLTTNHTGIYTCTVYNEFGGQNYTANKSINVTVVETTTPPPTTTTTTTTRSSSTVSATKNPGTATANGNNTAQADSTTGMIIGIVIGGVVVIVAIIIAIVCIKKRKKQEIEEPAEKPRNNRDLVFTGNRPDLVTNDEKWRNNQNNHVQNTSLNNSYDSSDSRLKAEGQLTYVDLQFDDKPRSRKPIQLIDTGSTPYADIAMPRV